MSYVCLITGASRGLGEKLAHRFWDAGYSLCLVARNLQQLDRVGDSLPPRIGQKVHVFECELGESAQILELCSRVEETVERLDVLINNAATQGPIGPLSVNERASWKRSMDINLLAPVYICQAFVPLMAASDGGAIINVSGGGATGPRENFSAYATAKAGLVRFSETLALEVSNSGISVNCVAPGAMRTSMTTEVLDTSVVFASEGEIAAAQKIVDEGGASMDKVADLMLFLSSRSGKGITGKLISAIWDDWEHWPEHLDELSSSDVYTLRRITGRDRGLSWGDK